MKEYSLIELIEGLSTKKWTSVDLVSWYLDEIMKNNLQNKSLNCVSEINPYALEVAKQLDIERTIKGPRGLLHGVPVLLKDNINTLDGMHTTASSHALKDFYAPYEATIVKKLKDAGMIILGKTNLSEFAYFMSYENMPSGYGSLNGQVKNPYGDDIDPLGSSTGSAVAVAANMICVAVGTETNGSLMAPALANSIVAIKPTLGLVSRYGIIPISHLQDTAGPMARSVVDAAILLQEMVGKDTNDISTQLVPKQNFDFVNAYQLPLDHVRVGILEFDNFEYDEEEKNILLEAQEVLQRVGVQVERIVFHANKMANDQTLLYEFKNDLNAYFNSVRSTCPIHTLEELIAHNNAHPVRCMKYGQSIFEASEKTKGTLIEHEYYQKRIELVKEAARFEELMLENDVNCLISTRRTSYAPIHGNPSISVPAKALTDKTPRSVVFVAKKFDDELLISIAHKYESLSKKRIPPVL